MLFFDGIKQALGTSGLLAPLKAAGQLLTLHPGEAIKTLVKSPFNLVGGALKSAVGVPLAPFELIGGMFGAMRTPAMTQGANAAMSQYV